MPRIHFVSFATPSFRPRQTLLEMSAKWLGGADMIETWNPKRLARDGFLDRHAELFPGSKGFGWYAWKPHIILQTLLSAAEGDLVVYQDVGRREPVLIRHHLTFWQRYLDERSQNCVPGVAIPWWGPNRIWTKHQAFVELGLNEPRYQESPQIQASWSVWRKCHATLEFVREWSSLCVRRDLVSGELPDGLEGEAPGFVEHRWDQSLLTLLTWRENLQPIDSLLAPLTGFNEKSCDHWMHRIGAAPGNLLVSFAITSATWMYAQFERVLKLGFKRREHVTESTGS